MNREARGVILALVAVMLLRLSLTDEYLLYVKSSMRPWLIISGALLAALSAIDLFGWFARPDTHDQTDPLHHDRLHDHDDDHTGHRHGVLPWILAAPFVVVFAIGPSPLGAFMAQRQPATERINTEAASSTADADDDAPVYRYPDLPEPVDGAVELRITDFVSRAAYDSEQQMDGVLVRLEGFVTPDDDGDGDTFLLTKFVLSCCAADGFPVSIRAHGLDPLPVADTWLRVEGFWLPHETEQLPPFDEFEVVSVEEIPVPENPYL